MSAKTPTLSIPRLRVLILVALVAGITIFTGVMFGLVQRLSHRFGPQVEADLEWRATRGAQELARAADLGLAVSDAEIVKDAFGAYAKAADVKAIIAVDASGKVVAQHGTFAEADRVFAAAAGSLVDEPSYLASWAPAVIEGNAVGKVAVVVAKERLAAAQTQLHEVSMTTVISGVVALLLGVLVILFFTHAVSSRDAQLKDYAANLERKVDERTRELDARNQGMRRVLDNVAQGFMTIDVSGVLAAERSAIVERWFGAIAAGTTFGEAIRPHAPEFATWFELGLDSVREDILPRELTIAQLPQRFTAGDKVFRVDYSPIESGDALEGILLIVSDVSAEVERERTQREQREILEIFQRVTSDRQGFDEFFEEASTLVTTLGTPGDRVVEKRLIHTLKGNCGIYGLLSFAELCHAIETQLEESGGELAPDLRERLIAGWTAVLERLSPVLGETHANRIEVDRGALLALADKVRQGVSARDTAATLVGWSYEPVEIRFQRLARHATSLARRLGKADVRVAIEDHGIRLNATRYHAFWSAMVHAVRNAVDHGIESRDDREGAGKPTVATLTLAAERRAGSVVLKVSDDGRGIDWERVRAKAAAAGLPSRDHTDLVAALFSDGLSTRDVASETSGRGVGLGALRGEVLALGGAVDVSSERGRGTQFVFTLPDPDYVSELRPPTQPMQKFAALS